LKKAWYDFQSWKKEKTCRFPENGNKKGKRQDISSEWVLNIALAREVSAKLDPICWLGKQKWLKLDPPATQQAG
jgi:hypothetical protein